MALSPFSSLIALGAVLGHLYLLRRLVWNLTPRRTPRLVAARGSLQARYGWSWEQSAGHHRHGDSHIYVSRGRGFWSPPMRLGSPPELVKRVLTS